jgi:hypothetical protein
MGMHMDGVCLMMDGVKGIDDGWGEVFDDV